MIVIAIFTATILAYAHGILAESTACLESGRFRSRDPTCKSYFLCVQSRSGSFITRNYVCPETTIFNPSTGRCSAKASCIENICNEIPSSVTKIADPNSSDRKTYIECAGPGGNRYPILKKCDVGYFNGSMVPEPGCSLLENC